MALDKKSDDTRFGSRLYTFLDWAITEKGIGREKTSFGTIWANPYILDVSGMSGVIKWTYPFDQVSFSSLPANPAASPRPSLAISSFHHEKGVREIGSRRFASRSKAPGLEFLIASSFSLSQGTLIPDLIQSKRLGYDFGIPSVEMLHYLSRSNAQSLELICEGLNPGTLVRVAGRAHQMCPVWGSRAGFAPLFQSS